MAEDNAKVAEAPTKVSTNPLAVEFATDPMGLMVQTKAAVLALGDRIGNSDESLELALSTLTVLAQHLIARHEGEVKAVKAEIQLRHDREVAKRKRLKAEAAKTKAARVKSLEEALSAAKAQ